MTILINTGPSERGFHRLEAFWNCEMKFFWSEAAPRRVVNGVMLDVDPPLARGSIGHAGLAHYYARKVAAERGKDPDTFFSVDDAMSLVSETFGDVGRATLPEAAKAVRYYQAQYVAEDHEVIGIERHMETEFEGWRYTARADLVVRYPRDTGKIYIWDHKFVGRIEDRTFQRYELSGQFLGLWHLGRRQWGNDFGGVRVNVIGCNKLDVERREPEPAPWALQRYPHNVALAEQRIALLRTKPSSEWSMSDSEMTCVTPYGRCQHTDRCRWGVP